MRLALCSYPECRDMIEATTRLAVLPHIRRTAFSGACDLVHRRTAAAYVCRVSVTSGQSAIRQPSQ